MQFVVSVAPYASLSDKLLIVHEGVIYKVVTVGGGRELTYSDLIEFTLTEAAETHDVQ